MCYCYYTKKPTITAYVEKLKLLLLNRIYIWQMLFRICLHLQRCCTFERMLEMLVNIPIRITVQRDRDKWICTISPVFVLWSLIICSYFLFADFFRNMLKLLLDICVKFQTNIICPKSTIALFHSYVTSFIYFLLFSFTDNMYS